MHNSFPMEDLFPILTEVIDSGGVFRLFPRGTSMLPMLREGVDSVLLVRAETPEVHDVWLYRRANGQFVLHRVMALEEDGTLAFCGDNQTEWERGVPRDALIARMKGYYAGETYVDGHDPAYLRYVRKQCRMSRRRFRFFLRRTAKNLFRKK